MDRDELIEKSKQRLEQFERAQMEEQANKMRAWILETQALDLFKVPPPRTDDDVPF